MVRFKTRRREKVKAPRGPMPELQRQAGSAVEDEIRRHSIQFRPQPQLGLWQDIQARIKACRHMFKASGSLPEQSPRRQPEKECSMLREVLRRDLMAGALKPGV